MIVRGRAGFTMVELTVVLVVLGVVLAVAIPNYVSMVRNTRAANVVAELEAVRTAAFMYYGDHSKWPKEHGNGVVPREFKPYLPPGFSFYSKRYQLDWENWILPRGRLRYPSTGIAIGVSVFTRDRKLLEAVQGLLRNSHFGPTVSTKYTLELAGPDGF